MPVRMKKTSNLFDDQTVAVCVILDKCAMEVTCHDHGVIHPTSNSIACHHEVTFFTVTFAALCQ